MAISLIDAIRRGDIDLARKLLNNRKYKEIDGQTARKDGTALYWACCMGILEIVHLLILHDADVNAETGWKSTPLHAACDNNHQDVIRLLIKCGANVNETTRNGDTPCHLAAYRGFAEIVQILVESGANIEILNNKYKTVMEEARNKGHEKIVKYLSAVRQIVNENSKHSNQLSSEENDHMGYFPSLKDITKMKNSNRAKSMDTEWGCCGLKFSGTYSEDYDGDYSSNDLSVTSNRNYQSQMSFKNI